MARDIKLQILRHIALAQICSDSGKGIRPEGSLRDLSGSLMAYRNGYDEKVNHIVSAIKLINKIPPCGILYRAEKALDQNGYESILVYFNISKNVVPFINKRHQVSFHTPYGKAKELFPYINKGGKTRWTHNLGESKWFSSQIANWLVNI